jgi:hypothetical protein
VGGRRTHDGLGVERHRQDADRRAGVRFLLGIVDFSSANNCSAILLTGVAVQVWAQGGWVGGGENAMGARGLQQGRHLH